MILRKLQTPPQKIVPLAMMLVIVGLAMPAVGGVWLRLASPAPHFGVASTDFLRGFFIGIGIALEVFGVVLLAAATRARKS
jgi:hypothetical protein